MSAKKFFIILFLTVFLNAVFIQNSHAQKRNVKLSTTKISKSKERPVKSKIIFGGVVNGKAINLVKPEYPLSARFVKIKGTVHVQVLIDENGDIIKAEAKRGHPFLFSAALKAARASKFEPFVSASGQKLKVTGIIVYKFISDSMNWLELGFNSDSIQNLQKYLPLNFEEERQLLQQTENLTYEEKTRIVETVLNSIENKLSSEVKAAWLFSVGRKLNLLVNNHWDKKIKQNVYNELQNLLYSAPENVSLLLKRKVEKLISAKTKEEFTEDFLDLTEKIYALGN